MAEEYKLDRRSATCTGCGREFAPGEAIVSAIRQAKAGFLRSDSCESCAQGAPPAFSVWRGHHPEPVEDPHRLDFELAGEFLADLLEQQGDQQAGLAYVLTLLLARKRRLKILATRDLDGGEELEILLPRPEEDRTLKVAVPRLDSGAIEAVQTRLAELFGFASPPPGKPAPTEPAAKGGGAVEPG